jgi:hypothetical protein
MHQKFMVGSSSALFLVWQTFATAISQDTKTRAKSLLFLSFSNVVLCENFLFWQTFKFCSAIFRKDRQ